MNAGGRHAEEAMVWWSTELSDVEGIAAQWLAARQRCPPEVIETQSLRAIPYHMSPMVAFPSGS